jgi:hypothetical protein
MGFHKYSWVTCRYLLTRGLCGYPHTRHYSWVNTRGSEYCFFIHEYSHLRIQVTRESTCAMPYFDLYDALSTRHCTPLHTPPHSSTRSCTLFDALLNALRRIIACPSTPFDARFRPRRTVSTFSTSAAAAADALFAQSLAALPASTHPLHVPPVQSVHPSDRQGSPMGYKTLTHTPTHLNP